MGAEFVRGRVCQGPSLLGAEMSRNQINVLIFYYKANKDDQISLEVE